MPIDVQKQIYSDFLFKKFLDRHDNFFEIMKTNDSFFSPDDVCYQDFIILILKNLEPKFIESFSIFQKQKQEVDEIIFIMKGSFEVGYNHDYFMFKKEQSIQTDFHS